MPLVPNNTKRKMQAGEVALGFGVHHLRSAAAPALAAATGHDWLFLDNEHGAFSVQRDRAALHRLAAHRRHAAGAGLRQCDRRGDARAGQRCARHRHAACRYREGGAPHRRGVSLSAAGPAKLGRAAGGLWLSARRPWPRRRRRSTTRS